MSEHIVERQEERILWLILNRPEKKNALTMDMYQALAEALNKAGTEPAIRVVVITGRGDAFTSGNDIQDFLQSPPTGTDDPVSRFLKALAEFPKPLMAAVNGTAVGIGTTMLLHCDLAYAAKSASFQLPFLKLALVPEAASTLLLPLVAGHRKAAELFLLGESFGPEEAARCGLLNDIVADDDLETEVAGVAGKIAAMPPEAVRQTKALMKTSQQAVVEAMQREGEIFLGRLRSPEAIEALTAFMEKREADYSRFE